MLSTKLSENSIERISNGYAPAIIKDGVIVMKVEVNDPATGRFKDKIMCYRHEKTDIELIPHRPIDDID